MVVELKISDYIKIYKELDIQKVSLDGRIVGAYPNLERFHLCEDDAVVVVKADRSCQGFGSVKHGDVVRVTGSPGEYLSKPCIHADSFVIISSYVSDPKQKTVSASNEFEPKPLMRSTHPHFEALSKHQFRFKSIKGIKILQPPIQQRPNKKCAFAAIARQLEYQFRILYAKTGMEVPQVPMSSEGDNCFFDYKRWEDDLKKAYPEHLTRWKPSELLAEARTCGLPLWNGGSHMIQSIKTRLRDKKDRDKLVHYLKEVLESFPVVGVMPICSQFSDDGSDIYEGGGSVKFDGVRTKDGKYAIVPAHHAVVLIDFAICDDISYVAYQNSLGNPNNSMCEMGIGWERADLIVEVHFGCASPPIHPPSSLQTLEQMQLVLRDVKQVTSGLKLFQEYLRQGEVIVRQIDKVRKMRSSNSKEIQARVELVEDYVRKIRNIHESMDEFKSKYRGIGNGSVVGVITDIFLTLAAADDKSEEVENAIHTLQGSLNAALV